MESLENNPSLVEFPDPRFAGGRFFFAGDGPKALSEDAWRAWMLKRRATLYPKWLRDLPAEYAGDPLFARVWPASQKFLEDGLADDARNWNGWGKRNGRHRISGGLDRGNIRQWRRGSGLGVRSLFAG